MIVQVTLILGLAIIWWIRKSSKPAHFPPGPPRYPVLGSYYATIKPGESKPNLFWTIRKFAKDYGSVFGFYLSNTPFVVVTEFEDLKEVLKRDELAARGPNEPGNRFRPGWNTIAKVDPEVNKGRNPGVIGGNGRYWKEQRRFLLRNLRDFGFGKSSMEESLQDEAQKLIKFLKTKSDKPIDLNRTMNISIVNALWGILVGERLELTDPKLLKILTAFDELLRGNNGNSSLARLLPFKSMALWPGFKHWTGFEAARKVFEDLQNFVKPYIDEHSSTLDTDNVRDFMDLMLLEVKNCKDPESSFFGETGHFALFNNMIDLFIAGMETTSSALLWTILYMLHYPDIQARVHAELDEVVGKDRPPSLDDKPNLHFTNAVLLESFRVTSFVPMSVPHYALADIKLRDYVIPKGCVVLPSLFHVMYDEKHFANPKTFHPDRFIDESGHFVDDERVIPFSIGKRYCLGQSLAEKEFFLFFAGLMQQFEFQRVPGAQLPPYSVDEVQVKGILRSAPPFEVILNERQ